MTSKFTNYFKQKLLNGEITPAMKNGRIHFNSIRLGQWRGVMLVEFCYDGNAIMCMECQHPNFALGATLTLTGVDGSVEAQLEGA